METYFSNMTADDGTKDKFLQDLARLARDAEELVKAATGQAADKSKAELAGALERLQASCRRIQRRASEGVRTADRVIRDHPYPSLGLAFGVGLLIGALIDRGARR